MCVCTLKNPVHINILEEESKYYMEIVSAVVFSLISVQKWKLENVVTMTYHDYFMGSFHKFIQTCLNGKNLPPECGPVQMIEAKGFSKGVKSIHTVSPS